MGAAVQELKAARQFEPLDPRLARETYLDALAAATFAGRLALGGGMREVAEAARVAPPPPGPARGPDLLLDGLALLICEGYPAGAPVLRRAVSAFRGTDVSTEEGLRGSGCPRRAAQIVWDYASWDVSSDRQVTLARDAGALIALPIALNMRAAAHVFVGEFTEAASMGRRRLGNRGDREQHRAGRRSGPCRLPRPGNASRSPDPDRHRRCGAPG